MGEVPALAVRVWTSAARLPPNSGVELCGILNRTLRDDTDEALLRPTVSMCRAIKPMGLTLTNPISVI